MCTSTFIIKKGECGLKVSNGHHDSSLLSHGIVKKKKKGFYLLNFNSLILYSIAKMSGKYPKKKKKMKAIILQNFENLETKLKNGSNLKEKHGLSCKRATL